MEATTRERTTKVFQFLQEFTGLKYKPQRTSDNDSLLWLHSLPQEPEVTNAARLTEREVTPDEWLVLRKPKFRPAPMVPAELTDWLTSPVGQPDRPPVVLTQRVITTVIPDDDLQPQQIQETLFLEDDAQALAAWGRYEREWHAWAAEERRARTVQDRYSQLFDFHQKLESFGETYELRLGLGYLAWRTPGGSEVRRHLLTARAALTFDALRGVLTVTAAGDGARTTLEQDMLDADERPLAQVQDHIHQALAESGEEVWSATILPQLLEAWVNAAGERGSYLPELTPPRGAPADPTVHWAPALILRRRGERSLVAAYADIVRQAGQLDTIPEPLRRFVEVSNEPPGRGMSGTSGGQRATEVYFPLPANDAQLEIIRRLERQPGVLVQGPPGTGKSHTIVNLVSHLLATDQRVLVTSHTARALKVLRDKFPAELAALCVTHLRGEEGAKATLERSVQEITQRSAHREPETRETARLNALSYELEKARKEEDTLLDDLRRIRQGEVGDLNLEGYLGSAQETGARLRAQEAQFGWLTELGNPVQSAPLTDAQALRLLALLREFTAEEETELAQHWNGRDTLLAPETFLQFVREEAEAVTTSDRHAGGRAHLGFATLQDTAPDVRRALLDALRELSRAVQTIHAGPDAWLIGAVAATLKGQAGLWQEVRAQTDAHLPSLLTHGDWLEETAVSGLGTRDPQTVQADAETVLAHLRAGGGWGNFLMKPAAVKTRQYLREEVRVGGRAADTPEVLEALLQHFRLHQRLAGLETLWKEVGLPVSGSMKRRLLALREAQEALTRLDELQDRLTEARTATRSVAGLPEPRWWDSAELDRLTAGVQAASAEATATARRQVLNDLLPALEGLALRPDTHPVTRELIKAVQTRDPDAYSQAHRRVLHLTARKQLLEERDQLMATLRRTAPTLADELRTQPEDAVWDERLRSLEAAWRWLRADAELARLSNPDTEVDVRQRLAACRQRIRDTLRDLATHRAWVNTLNRLTQREQQGLVRWQRAMKSLGKGTGKHAERHRQTARAALEEARTAIPAWIMPLHLVGETFTLRPGMFDVVIVDEASQAGPESLFLTFIAKKIIIVGDDKQIEPEGVGLQTDRLDALVGRYLTGLPAPEILGERKASLFGFGAYTYADRISLREHFRCMPEIIKFSSELSYEDQPLIALRQFGADRLAPLVARHVTDGYTVPRGDKTNPAEARAIVDQIKACILDPRYRDADGRAKTIGVVSLVGDTQAEEIAALLRAEVSERELEERKVVCGNA
ncbi:DEAD/DEAH box helicase [Deinococcus radiotolerans]|uniref:DNA2/NAM7 helicase helicase domain-containing protein n=1 Tax=Deinococcus radiotolerans TaxID=1309407 RepID=A0ABQ2FDY1_9DEIO|nr:AAA domain-containing protein [Deinococcus radiotolerans]GGK85698.1 hypothetical protein GCM10010844_00260 [Deinococcus radiotolerans]